MRWQGKAGGLSDALEPIDRHLSLGVFVVPCGELESWMDLSAPKGNKWSQQALQELHEGEYPLLLRKFVEQILVFLANAKVCDTIEMAVEA